MRIRDVFIPDEIPILPVRDTVLFPNMNLPLSIGRKKSLRILEYLQEKGGGVLGIVAQKESETEDPGTKDLHMTGCVARIVKSSGLMEGSASILVQGVARMKITGWASDEPFLRARIQPQEEESEIKDVRVDAMLKQLRILVTKIIQMSPNIPNEAIYLVEKIPSPGYLADTVAHYLDLPLAEKQEVLEQFDLIERLKKVTTILTRELDVLELSQKIQGEVKDKIDKHQREYFLREQMKVIQRELGDSDGNEDLEKLKEAVAAAGMTEEARTIADKELKRLQRMNPISPEYQVTRTYVEWLTELPWNKTTEDNLDLARAAEVLDEDHYGLTKVKDRIIEYLAVTKLKNDLKGPILCLQGPPGVGKTSLGKSVARALGRKFIRMSLGGVRDEAEIRGHRRTYVGALPGRIIQGMKKVKSRNPVFLLDEIDKLGMDFRGDPSAALLEALDPEQNDSFSDHYVEAAFDLSRVLFITTANMLDTIPIALRDRLEIISIPGYSLEEKMHIARKYLIPELKEDHGLLTRDKETKAITEDKYITFRDDAVRKVIHDYTWEAGVRGLKRELASVCRGVARDVAGGKGEPVEADVELISRILGKPRFQHDVRERLARPGVVTGLSVTPAGGEILFVEAASMRGKGAMTLTGQLGEVMKESAQAALTFVKGMGRELGIAEDAFEKNDIHVHVPAGAMPKDGPSAGVAMMTAIASLLAGRLVRPDTAMTGEITLRGHVLPVGGIKEKVLAAHRADLRRVLLPERNRKDVDDIPAEIQKEMEFIFVKEMREVFREALEGGFAPILPVPAADGLPAAIAGSGAIN